VNILKQLYAFAFSARLWFRDKDSLLVTFLIGYELVHVAFRLQVESLGDKGEIFGLDALSKLNQVSKDVLMCEDSKPWILAAQIFPLRLLQ